MDFHATRWILQRFSPTHTRDLIRTSIVALVALASVAPLVSVSQGMSGGSMVFSLEPLSCPANDTATGLPVFTEDACTGVDHTFALTGPNGMTEEFTAMKSVPSADFEVGPYFSVPDGPDGSGEWIITDLDHASGAWVIPSCRTGHAAGGVMSSPVRRINDATYAVEWEGAGTSLTCDWFEFTPNGSGDTPAALHLETIPTAESQMLIGEPRESILMERVIAERPDITVPMRLIDQGTGDEITFEADADGSLLIDPGEYELINDLTGESRVFSTSRDGSTIALVGVPLDAIEQGGTTTPETADVGDETADSSETTSVNITVSLCEDIILGTGIDCSSIDFDEPQPVLDVLVDGEPSADGLIPLENSGIGMRATIDVPLDSTLTIAVAENVPDGYVPADGYDPLVIAADAVPEGGCGGEATCPVVDIVLVPAGQ